MYFAHHLYEQGNKCGRLLARPLKKQESHPVHTLSVYNKWIVDTQSIASEFHCFYASLYNIPPSSPNTANRYQVDNIQDYFRDSALPALSPAVLEELKCPITIEELGPAVAAIPPGKSPGPDGLTNAYYEIFFSKLVSPLCSYFNSITISNPLPPETLLAKVMVLPKPGKDP